MDMIVNEPWHQKAAAHINELRVFLMNELRADSGDHAILHQQIHVFTHLNRGCIYDIAIDK